MSVSICETCRHRRYCNGAIVEMQDTVCTGCSHYRKALPVSNADRIRAYSDENIAELFNQIETEGKAYGPRGKKAWLDWLKQEATG